MDPAVPKATLKVLGLCAALLVLVAAVTVSVAVMVWRSEAVGKLRGCRERAANESRELGNRLAELERERSRLQRAAAAGARAEGALRRELAQARGDAKKFNVSLAACRERAARLEVKVAALGDEALALRHERAELARDKAALQEEVARGEEQALGLGQRLEEAAEQRRALRARGEQCEARQRELEAALRDYAAEVDALRRRARDRPTGRRCPPSRYFLGVLPCLQGLGGGDTPGMGLGRAFRRCSQSGGSRARVPACAIVTGVPRAAGPGGRAGTHSLPSPLLQEGMKPHSPPPDPLLAGGWGLGPPHLAVSIIPSPTAPLSTGTQQRLSPSVAG
ncbi:coiled-coil domain-containing protein 194 [Athene noctua]|uniref:coiled-coil domain-containing protein 194 n=1 Tax=Athene noctua TaxID=126797 RepID=UPI003EBC2DD0